MKTRTDYNGGYLQSRSMAMDRGWSTAFIQAQMVAWLKARQSLMGDPAYFEHICGVVDALADILIARRLGK